MKSMEFEDLRKHFIHTKTLRESNGDLCLCDQDFDPGCGYMSMAEVKILQRVAALWAGRWFEAGTHTGWSAAHIAKANNVGVVVSCDPGFAKNRPMYERALVNLVTCGVNRRVHLMSVASDDFVLANEELIDGCLIDGDHSGDAPLRDAQNALRFLTPLGVIVFHDIFWPGVEGSRRALEWLGSQGLATRQWHTMHGIGVASYDRVKVESL